MKNKFKGFPDRDERQRLDDEFNELKKTVEFEKGDTLALIIAALTTILPFALIVFAIIMGIAWLLFF